MLARASHPRVHFFRPVVEPLEDRMVPSSVSWVGGSGNWDNPSHWNTGLIPTSADTVLIQQPNVQVTVSDNEAAGSLSLAATDTVSIASSGSLTLAGLGLSIANGSIINAGKLVLTGPQRLQVNTLTNQPGGIVDLQGDIGIVGGTFTNRGTLEKSQGAGTSVIQIGVDNTGGTIDDLSGAIQFAGIGTLPQGGIVEGTLDAQTLQRQAHVFASVVLSRASTMIGALAAPAVFTFPVPPETAFLGALGRPVGVIPGVSAAETAAREAALSPFFAVGGMGNYPHEGWGSISGQVFLSLGPDGKPETGEKGLPGQHVILEVQTLDGQFVPLRMATTNAEGEYSFQFLGPSVYRVELEGCSAETERCRHNVILKKEGAKVEGQDFGRVRRGTALPGARAAPALRELLDSPLIDIELPDFLFSDEDFAPWDGVFQEVVPADGQLLGVGTDRLAMAGRQAHPSELSPMQVLLAAALAVGTSRGIPVAAPFRDEDTDERGVFATSKEGCDAPRAD